MSGLEVGVGHTSLWGPPEPVVRQEPDITGPGSRTPRGDRRDRRDSAGTFTGTTVVIRG